MADDQSMSGLKPGDLCHHGQNAVPCYRVIFVHHGKAWLRDVNTGQDAVVDSHLCRPVSEPVAEPSAEPTPLTWPDGTPRP